jgi:hypothetical protein
VRANPVASADLRAAFGRTGELRGVAAFLAALAAVLYAWWPRSNLAWHLRTATPPQTFAAVSIAVFLLAGYLNARAGTGDRAAPGEHAAAGEATLADLVALTPVSIASVVAGRMVAGALVALFHLALAVPFLVVALGVSGVAASVLPATAAVIAAAALAWRAAALALRLALPEHPILRDVLLLAASAAWLAVTFVVAPAANPLAALVDLAGGGHRALEAAGVSLPFFAVSAIIAVLVIAVCGVVSWAALRAARAAARKTAFLAGKGHDPNGTGLQR